MARDFLVYIPCNQGEVAADLWGGDRLYDVVLNDYTGTQPPDRGEYSFAMRGHKWPCIYRIPELLTAYKAVCFLDDDVEIDTERLNRLFCDGMDSELNLWQASASQDSRCSYPYLFQNQALVGFRKVPLVEIMMPVFSRKALKICWPSFCESESGYGLDFLWPKLLNNERLAVSDSIVARHAKPISSEGWTLSNGKTPIQEWAELEQKFNLKEWRYE